MRGGMTLTKAIKTAKESVSRPVQVDGHWEVTEMSMPTGKSQVREYQSYRAAVVGAAYVKEEIALYLLGVSSNPSRSFADLGWEKEVRRIYWANKGRHEVLASENEPANPFANAPFMDGQ
jgi:hypothetical protein